MGFQPGANLYGIGVGARPENVEVPHLDTRAPAASDVNYPVGKVWVNTAGNAVYVLTSLSAFNGAVTANWQATGGGSSAVASINNNAPVGGNYTLAGTGNQIAVAQSAGTTTFSIPSSPSLAGTLTVATGLTATTGDIVATVGDIDATAGALSAGTTVTAGTGITATTGDIVATVGDIDATAGALSAGTTVTAGTGITATTGDIVATVGDIDATSGALSAGTTVTAGTGITATTGDIVATVGDIDATAGALSAGTTVTAGTGITATTGDITATNGNLVLGQAGNKINIATGTNASAGTSGAMTGGIITVNTSAVTNSSLIFAIPATLGTVTTPQAVYVSGTTPNTSFTLTSADNTDTSTWNWWLIN